MRKIAGLGLIVTIIAVSVAIWAKASNFTRQAQALTSAGTGISPLELHLQVDVKHMRWLEIPDPI